MKTLDMDSKNNILEEENSPPATSPPVPLVVLIDALRDLAQSCRANADIDSVVAACQGARNAWMAIHQSALHNPMLISPDLCTRAEEGIRACLDAIKASPADQNRLAPIARNINVHLELIQLIRSKGLAAADQRLKKLMHQSDLLPV
jgi:hypothetical protein